MILIGLTGSLGCGKTTVANLFAEFGARIIDVDNYVHQSLKPNGSCYKKVVKMFGQSILKHNEIDRKALAQIVFSDPKELKRLTQIIHPIILKEVQRQIRIWKRDRKNRFVVIDAPLLIEAKWHTWVDYVIVVKASRLLQLQRIAQSRHLSRAQAIQRLKMQMPMSQKINMADIVIDNRNELTETRKNVEKIVQMLYRRAV